MTQIKIYHNPRCSKSRETLALINQHPVEVEIVDYLVNPPSASELAEILKKLKLKPRDIMRSKETEYTDSGLNNPELSEAQQIQLMVAHPKVIERPLVVCGDQAVIGRPPENVLQLLK